MALTLLLALLSGQSQVLVINPASNPVKTTFSGAPAVSIANGVTLDGGEATVFGRATTAAPTYVNGTDDPLSLDLGGGLRINISGQSLAAVTVQGTVTTSPPSNASTNVSQWGGVATTLGQKVSASSVPVVLSSDFTPTIQGTVSTNPPANASTNVTQWNGNTVNLGSGTGGSGTLRVIPDSASALQCNAGTNLNTSLLQLDTTGAKLNVAQNTALGSTTGPMLQALAQATGTPPSYISGNINPVNMSQNGAVWMNPRASGGSELFTTALPGVCKIGDGTNTAPLQGTGHNLAVDISSIAGGSAAVGATGTLRVSIVGQAGTVLETTNGVIDYNLKNVNNSAVSTAATGVQKVGLVGNAGAAVDAANNAAAPANVVVTGVETIAQGSNPTAATGGNVRRALGSTEGVQYFQLGNGNFFSCFKEAITATTQCQAAPGAGLRAYVTSLECSNEAATVQTVDVVYGTGTNCGTGITALTHKFQMGTAATTTSPQEVSANFINPLVPVAANAICVRPAAATAFGCTITGFIAP